MPELVDSVVAGLAGELDLPFAFFGHSLGALVGFEVARRLAREGLRQPSALFLSAASAPHLGRTGRTFFDLPRAELLEEVRAYGGTPVDVLDDPAFMDVYLPILRADFELFETYSHDGGARPNVPVFLYGGLRDDRVSQARLCAWRDLADVVSVEMFDGGHFYLRDHYRSLISAINRELAGPLGVARAA